MSKPTTEDHRNTKKTQVSNDCVNCTDKYMYVITYLLLMKIHNCKIIQVFLAYIFFNQEYMMGLQHFKISLPIHFNMFNFSKTNNKPLKRECLQVLLHPWPNCLPVTVSVVHSG